MGTRAIVVLAATIALLWPNSKATTEPGNDVSRSLDRLVEEKNYSELKRELSSARLLAPDRAYFYAILDDRSNHPAQAAAGLEKVLPELRKTNQHRAAIALHALAYDDFDLGRYGAAADAMADLLNNFSAELSAAEKKNSENDGKTFDLLRGAPPQTVSGEHTFKIALQRDAIFDEDVPITVGRTTYWWIFDTGANITTISSSTAKRMGLTLSKRQAATQSGATGTTVPLSTAVIPELHFGGANIHNAVAIVTDDKQLDIDLGTNGHYRIAGILGWPVLAALGSFTVKENEMTVAPEGQASARSAPLYLEELTPVVEAKVGGRELLFQFDTGESNTELSARYVRAFPEQFASLKKRQAGIGGAGGVRPLGAYSLPQLELKLGDADAVFTNITAVAQDRGVDPQDSLYGNLGQGLLSQFRSYTIDFRNMRLTLGENTR